MAYGQTVDDVFLAWTTCLDRSIDMSRDVSSFIAAIDFVPPKWSNRRKFRRRRLTTRIVMFSYSLFEGGDLNAGRRHCSFCYCIIIHVPPRRLLFEETEKARVPFVQCIFTIRHITRARETELCLE